MENRDFIDKTIAEAFDILSIEESDFRSIEDKTNQDELICSLISNPYLYYFLCNLLYKTLKLSVSYLGETATAKIIDSTFVKTKDISGNNVEIINKPGFICNKNNQCNIAIEIVKNRSPIDFYNFNVENNTSFSQLMGAFYGYQGNNKMVRNIIKDDPMLSRQFVESFSEYFSIPKGKSFDELSFFVDESYGSWFYMWVMTYLNLDIHSLFKRTLGSDDPDYIRKKITIHKNDGTDPFELYEPFNVNKLTDNRTLTCKQAQFMNYDTNYLSSGLAYKKPRQNGVWFNIMKTYNKQILSGPSGSSLITFQFLLLLSKILDNTLENKVLLMLCIICDYYNYYHSISEVIQIYSVIADFEKYDLSKNDVNYIIDLIRSVGSLEDAVKTSIVIMPPELETSGNLGKGIHMVKKKIKRGRKTKKHLRKKNRKTKYIR